MKPKWLKTTEYQRTKSLAAECFGQDFSLYEYYEKDVYDNRIAVLEEEGKIYSMAHLKRFNAVYENYSCGVWYILYVCTAKEKRNMGYMRSLMNFVLSSLKNEGEGFAFLVPVDKRIYENLGFVHAWEFNESERDYLYADDDLKECFACLLNDEIFNPPASLKPADTVKDFCFTDFNADIGAKYFDFFYIRPNKTYDSVPLDCISYSELVSSKVCTLDDRCLIMIDTEDEVPSGCIPFCTEKELYYYFKLQERYFNEVLKAPFCAALADFEGVEYLKKTGALDEYEITENKEIFDYIYKGDDLRELPGKMFSKKRNRISKFCRDYDGRFEYKTLGYENRDEIISFLKKWDEQKTVEDKNVYCLNMDIGADKTLEIDVSGVIKMLKSSSLMSKVKAGGIYVDKKLSAFSLGAYNPLEKMAVIEVEKANAEMEGLYQLINREFLIHEFPEAELVNREDDVGLSGLRQSKMSYNPIMFARRYKLYQKNFKDL